MIDSHGRKVIPISAEPGAAVPDMGPPMYDLEAEQIMNVAGDCGIVWYVMNFNTGSPVFLTFEIPKTVTPAAIDAAQRLKARFDTDPAFRTWMIAEAHSAGSAFVERVQSGVVWIDA